MATRKKWHWCIECVAPISPTDNAVRIPDGGYVHRACWRRMAAKRVRSAPGDLLCATPALPMRATSMPLGIVR